MPEDLLLHMSIGHRQPTMARRISNSGSGMAPYQFEPLSINADGNRMINQKP
jgi:hypothetical protein